MPLTAGASFTLLTVRRNDIGVDLLPSLTVTVMVAVPNGLSAGVTVTVRFGPLPPNTTLAVGTNVVLDGVPVTVRLLAAVSASPIVNANAPVAVSSLTV